MPVSDRSHRAGEERLARNQLGTPCVLVIISIHRYRDSVKTRRQKRHDYADYADVLAKDSLTLPFKWICVDGIFSFDIVSFAGWRVGRHPGLQSKGHRDHANNHGPAGSQTLELPLKRSRSRGRLQYRMPDRRAHTILPSTLANISTITVPSA